MKKTLTCAALAAAASLTVPAYAEYPEKPIEIVVGYAAGGGTDVMARTVGKFLEAALGGSAAVVIKNEPGAGGQIGFTKVATAKPDGYTLGTFNLPAALALTYDRKADYTASSFTYLANFVEDPNTRPRPIRAQSRWAWRLSAATTTSRPSWWRRPRR
jgi:tripartite-type tricarboxylate transporter receptor subunit TctC